MTLEKTLEEEFGQANNPWQDSPEYIVRFWVGEQCMGYHYSECEGTCYFINTQTLHLSFPLGTVVIKGPRAWDFYNGFCCNAVTLIKADGADIESVNWIQKDTPEVRIKHKKA